MGITRRDFLMRVGQAGGYSAAFATMQSLGLMPMKGALAAPIQAAAGSGKGVKVVVLGAGIGGLVSERVHEGIPAGLVINVNVALIPLDQRQHVELARHCQSSPIALVLDYRRAQCSFIKGIRRIEG